MPRATDSLEDTMQVCRNGHVVTDRLRSCPERAATHCDRCGATTIERCETCGRELPGAIRVPGLHPMGLRAAPRYCATCGAAFPWTKLQKPTKRPALAVLENLLRRLPLAVRQLRTRHDVRPPFRIVDVYDLEDLLRSLLPLYFEDVRPECRTPSYAAGTRTDFLLAPERIALTMKWAGPCVVDQVVEDTAYYRNERGCRTLVVFIYDPEAKLGDAVPSVIKHDEDDEMEVRCVVA